METEKNCGNCRFFMKHYGRTDEGYYFDIFGCGHCLNREIPKKNQNAPK